MLQPLYFSYSHETIFIMTESIKITKNSDFITININNKISLILDYQSDNNPDNSMQNG